VSGSDQFRITFYELPKCSRTYKIWSEWVEHARSNSPGPLGFCSDCTKEYASEMRAIRMCEHTYVRFAENGDAFVTDEDKQWLISERKKENG